MPCSEISKPLSSSLRETLMPIVYFMARNIMELITILATATATTPISCGINAWSGENMPTARVPHTPHTR